MNKIKLKTKFGDSNSDYKKFRPTYPQLLFEMILKEVTQPYSNALDLGAGTGISTKVLSENFKNVVAIEPDSNMTDIGCFGSNVLLINDCTENVEFENDIYDLITAGNSFYWMNADFVLERMHRWLKKGGIVAAYRYDFPLTNNKKVNEIILHELTEHWDKFRDGRLKDTEFTYRNIKNSSFFCNVHLQKIDNKILLASEEIVGFFSSTSYCSAYLKSLSNPGEYLNWLNDQIKKANDSLAIEMDFAIELVTAQRK